MRRPASRSAQSTQKPTAKKPSVMSTAGHQCGGTRLASHSRTNRIVRMGTQNLDRSFPYHEACCSPHWLLPGGCSPSDWGIRHAFRSERDNIRNGSGGEYAYGRHHSSSGLGNGSRLG
jgi:hypothetical protein